MKRGHLENAFLSERLMQAASAVSVIGGLVSLGLLAVFHELTLLALFEGLVKVCVTVVLYRAFARYHWDVARGMMGGVLFCLLYQEGFLVLGSLWGGTVDFDAYLIMGVQGSLYLAAQSMSFMMTLIITVNHFIITYSNTGNPANVIFNQITISFKILLYIALMVINCFIESPTHTLITSGLGYVADLAVIIILICVEAQLDNFKAIRQELLRQKHRKGAVS